MPIFQFLIEVVNSNSACKFPEIYAPPGRSDVIIPGTSVSVPAGRTLTRTLCAKPVSSTQPYVSNKNNKSLLT